MIDSTAQRVIWRIAGAEALSFLQRIVTADMTPLRDGPGMVWAALLTPQGKYLADFFVARPPGSPDDGTMLIDIAAALAPDTLRRLLLYRLRADVAIDETPLQVERGTGAPPADALADPRHPAMGWRRWVARPGSVAPARPGAAHPARHDATADWDALRVAHLIPEFPADLVPGETYILEAGFERLGGVSFRKGCYIGQEVTARMKHKAVLRRGLVRVSFAGRLVPGTPVTLEDGREAGRLGTVSGSRGIAMLRLDRIGASLFAGGTTLTAEPV